LGSSSKTRTSFEENTTTTQSIFVSCSGIREVETLSGKECCSYQGVYQVTNVKSEGCKDSEASSSHSCSSQSQEEEIKEEETTMIEEALGVAVFMCIIMLYITYQQFRAMTKQGGER